MMRSQPENESIAAEILQILAEKDQKKIESLIEVIIQFDEKRLYALAQNTEIKAFFESNEKFNSRLAQSKRYPAFLPPITFFSRDSNSKCIPYNLLMGTFLLDQAEANQDNKSGPSTELFNAACEYGSLHALCKEMENNLHKVLKENPANQFKLIQEIYRDAAKLTNLYRALGALLATNTLIGLSINIQKNTLDAKKTIESLNVNEIVETAAYYFCVAYLTVDFPISKYLNYYFNENKNEFELLNLDFKKPEDCLTHFFKFIQDTFNIKADELLPKAMKDATDLVNQFPDEKTYFPKALKK